MRERLLAALSKPEGRAPLIAPIDGLRAIAILSVFLLHAATSLRRAVPGMDTAAQTDFLAGVASQGGVGVALFFALSGFLLALPFARHYLNGEPPVRLSDYYWRRVRRIEPPYLLALLLAFLAQVLLLKIPARELFPHLLASAAYLHNVVYGAWSRVLPVAWSLEIEVQFYLLAPLLCRLFFALRTTFARRAALLLAVFALLLLSSGGAPLLRRLHLDRSLLSTGHFFCLGLLLCEGYLTLGPPKRSPLWDAGGALGLCLLFSLYTRGDFFSQAGVLLGIFLASLAAFSGTLASRLAGWRPALILGGMCYSIYLLHYPILAALAPLTRRVAFTDSFALNLVLCLLALAPPTLALCALYFVLIERPCMSRRKK